MSDEGILKKSAEVVHDVVETIVEGVSHLNPFHRDHDDDKDERSETHEPKQSESHAATSEKPKRSSQRKSSTAAKRSGGSSRSRKSHSARSGEARPETKADLYRMARERGIPGRSKMSKEQLREALKA